MAVFYMRLTVSEPVSGKYHSILTSTQESLAGYDRRIKIFFALMVTMFVIVVSMPFLVCIPISKMWQITPDPGRRFYIPKGFDTCKGTIK